MWDNPLSGLSGHIVNVASDVEILGANNSPPYVASKFAVVGLTTALYRQLKWYRINTSVIVSSYIKTNIYRNSKVRYSSKLIEDFGKEKLDKISNELLIEMRNKAMSPDWAVKKYIQGIKNNQLYIYENKSILRSLVLKGQNPQHNIKTI